MVHVMAYSLPELGIHIVILCNVKRKVNPELRTYSVFIEERVN